MTYINSNIFQLHVSSNGFTYGWLAWFKLLFKTSAGLKRKALNSSVRITPVVPLDSTLLQKITFGERRYPSASMMSLWRPKITFSQRWFLSCSYHTWCTTSHCNVSASRPLPHRLWLQMTSQDIASVQWEEGAICPNLCKLMQTVLTQLKKEKQSCKFIIGLFI